MDQVIAMTRAHMQKAFELLQQDFATVRTGKASSSLIENIMISAYGGSTRLRVLELATITVSDPQTLLVTPFDQSTLQDLEKGIGDANVGLNPIVSGNSLRINLPPLTEERRREFVKLISQKAEQGKVMIRQSRHEAMDAIKKHTDSVSEDEVTRLEKDVQKVTDEYMDKIEQLKADKEKELMSL
jgi:ribosome recycling factor